MGGSRTGAGRPADPNSMRSFIRGLAGKDDFVTLPAEGRLTPAPEWPFELGEKVELAYWAHLWSKPQALMWEMLDLNFTVALYVRTFLEAAEPGASAGLKTAAIRLEGELGISLPGMKTLGWQISTDGVASVEPVAAPSIAARKTSSGDWLKAVSVEKP